MVMYGEMTRVW